MVKAADVVYKYYEVEFALKRENNDVLAWFGLFLAGIEKGLLLTFSGISGILISSMPDFCFRSVSVCLRTDCRENFICRAAHDDIIFALEKI